MVDTEKGDPTLCDCAIEVAELFAGVPTGGADGGSMLDLLAVRLEASRDRLRPPPPLAKAEVLSERAVLC
ncbi:hypothetical protein [Ensifer adhaerens]|uniref:hypothetical protein n=1 Tax=Ensifer adhaerens TaxID=106592 RepID=UPI000CF04889|nr:hypothetical protein [Ensifer adhaerens]